MEGIDQIIQGILIFIMIAIAIAFMVLSNHVHYTIDVLAAPFFVVFAITMSKKLIKYKIAAKSE